MSLKADIRHRLQNEILLLQGFKPLSAEQQELGLGPIQQAFPQNTFPLAAVHEFHSMNVEEQVAARAFVAGVLSALHRKAGVTLWVSASQTVFPPALVSFGICAEQILFARAKNEKEVLWMVEEALKCAILSAVVCEQKELSFTESRRFQLQIEKSGVPLFVLRHHPKNTATAAVTRWQIKPLPGMPEKGLPGVGYPRWQVSLLKVRNGKPGTWEVEWREGRFWFPSKLAVIATVPQKKTG